MSIRRQAGHVVIVNPTSADGVRHIEEAGADRYVCSELERIYVTDHGTIAAVRYSAVQVVATLQEAEQFRDGEQYAG